MLAARVYTNGSIPEHPGKGEWTRFVCISDTHSRIIPQVPDGDVFLHAGDLSFRDSEPEQFLADLRRTVHWLKALPHEMKV